MPPSPRHPFTLILVVLAPLLAALAASAAESFAALEARAQTGDVGAMLDVAHHYDWGTLDDIAQDLAAAKRWYRKAAEKGDSAAQLELGRMAYDGRGQPANAAEAAKWFRQAAEHGNSAAQHLLAGLYEQGEGVARNEPEALKWYRKAAEQEDSDSQFALGQMYAEGRGTAANPAEAARWWQRAAHAEHSGAADRLAALLETDPSLKNKVRALAPAATQQLIARATKGEGAAQYELARDYLDGGGWLLVDEAEAVQWLDKAAVQGNAVAQNQLALCYAAGRGVTQDNAAAERWWRKAAAQGLPEAHYNLGRQLADAGDSERYRDEILKEYRLAAEAGEQSALRALFDLYAGGGLVPADHATAFKYGQKLAEAGDAHAWYEMAEISEGDGKPAAARQWYEKARAAGNADAGDAIERLDTAAKKIAEAKPVPAPVPVPAETAVPTAPEAAAVQLAKLRETFEREFAAAESSYARNDAVKRFSIAVAANFSPPLDLTARSEAVLQSVGPKAEANIAEAYGYIMAIDSYTFDPKALPRFVSAATRDAIRVAATKTTDDYARRQAALNAMDATFKRAAAGDAQAQFELGQFFMTNPAAHDEATAADWFRKAAANGKAAAATELDRAGRAALQSGLAAFSAKDYATAMQKWKLAAEAGAVPANATIAMLYQNGLGVARDLPEAARWYQKAVDGGHSGAPAALSAMYEKGEGVAADPAQALKLARQSAELDNAPGIFQLAHCLVMGVGTAPNEAEALPLYRKLADKGDALSKDWIEVLGQGSPEARAERAIEFAGDTKEQGSGPHGGTPRSWVEYAARRGNADAQSWLADWREPAGSYPAVQQSTDGLKAYVEKNYAETLRLWLLAAAGGNPPAMNNLGMLYYHGVGVTRDLAVSLDWYTKAGDAGFVQGRVRARAVRAEIVFNAGLVAYNAGNYSEALARWRTAAALGSKSAFLNIGVMYESGKGGAADLPAALAWYQRAADLGVEQAKLAVSKLQAHLAGATELAQGRDALANADLAKAKTLFEKAAELGNAEALRELARLYARGNGATKDIKKAIDLYNQAEAKGDVLAGIEGEALEETLPLQNLAAAQKEMANLKDQINGTVRPRAPGSKGATTGGKDLRKNSPWTADEILAALQAGADHDALASALKADHTKNLYGIDVTRLHQTPAGQGIEEYSQLNMALYENSIPGAGAWTYDLAKAAVLARRQVTGREPKPVDSPELRQKAADGDIPSILAFYFIPTESLTQGKADPQWYGAPLEQRILATKYARGYWVIAAKLHNNVDQAKDDPARRAELLFQSAEAGDPKGMRELGMLFMEPGNPAVATNYAEAEYWLIEAAARAPEGALEDTYVNPGRDVAFFYSFAKSNGGPLMWPLSTDDAATLRWAREMIRRGGQLREVADLELQELERHASMSGVRARMDALPPEVPAWTAPEIARLERPPKNGDAAAALRLGHAYASGRGVHQRDPSAVAWYRLAAAKGSAPAMHALAHHYGKGYGVNKDPVQQIAWLEKAGAAGDATAWREAADLQHYSHTDSEVKQDYVRALADYAKAGAAGDAGAWMGLAMMHRYGRGVPKDEAKATEFLRKSAESGDGAGHYELGDALANAGDKANAIGWLQKAVTNPNTSGQNRQWAQQKLAELKHGMATPAGK